MTTFNAFHVHSNERGALPDDADCSHEILASSTGVTLSSSLISTRGAARWSARGEAGLSIGIVRGHMQFALDNRRETRISGGFGFCLSTAEPLVTNHIIEAESHLRGVFLHVPDASFEKLGIPVEESGAGAARTTRFDSWSPGRFLGAIAQQIADCPYEGALRGLFLEAKSLELLVAVLASRSDGRRPSSQTRPLTKSDSDRLVHGREILLASLSSPPSLDELARHIGMSTSRLTAGFRQLFSMSVVEFIQEQRLAVAMAAISEGNTSISQAAFNVGYTPAHFSTLFRKRYGYPPSLIARR